VQYDVFFSICQTPVRGYQPSEAEMFRNFFDQVQAADALGYGVAWVAESHLSSQVQKQNPDPVIPHWEGEVGLNVDILQLAQQVFTRTRRIEVGSAILNVLCNGGPVAHAERIAAFLALHGLDPDERRRIHIGFAAGRFDFMNRAYGVGPRNPLEKAAWGALKGQVFRRAAEAFVRLIRGDVLASDDLPPIALTRELFRSDGDWEQVQSLAGTDGPSIEVPPFFRFEKLKVIPAEFRRDLLVLLIGSHDPAIQEEINAIWPTMVFNLSITRPDVIEDTHRRLAAAYHPAGGPWQRANMPRTVFVFLNEQPGLTPEQRRAAAREEAREANNAYWNALTGTIDTKKVAEAADNALVGDAEHVARQIVERFHPDDRLMLWFDFFNHDNARVIANMTAFQEQVVPRVEAALAERREDSSRPPLGGRPDPSRPPLRGRPS
jgi:alkanesulfonate monooxygenase SsuD/methylene tetrahydromethanopterin reductase-like flavin-dependent oxidoreductase (luciferase family)